MNFELSDEQQLLADSLKRFLANDYTFDARSKIVASARGWSEEVWATLAEMGLMGLPFPAEHDGFGGTAVDVMVVMEAIGEGLIVEPYLPTVGLGGQFVARGGTPAQQQRILPALVQGQVKLALAQQKRGARNDLQHVARGAGRPGDGWVLDGENSAVTPAGCAV